jgi:hypothetical protein
VFTATIHQTNKIVGGTGQFTAAAGDFTATVTGRGVLPRGPDGSCDPFTRPAARGGHDHGNRHAVVLTMRAAALGTAASGLGRSRRLVLGAPGGRPAVSRSLLDRQARLL